MRTMRIAALIAAAALIFAGCDQKNILVEQRTTANQVMNEALK